ncbi:Transcriptional regulator, y4mF family, partial [Dysosmobacter welbionis]
AQALFKPLAVLVLQVQVQARQPGGVVRVCRQGQPQMGGVDFRLLQREGLAVQGKGPVQLQQRPLGGEIGVE